MEIQEPEDKKNTLMKRREKEGGLKYDWLYTVWQGYKIVLSETSLF